MSDAVIIAIISQKISELDEKIKSLFKKHGIYPKQNSVAQNEMQTIYEESVLSIHSHSILLVEVTSNNLHAFNRALKNPIIQYVLPINIRVILEVASTSIWLLDPDIDVKERVSRYCILRYRGLTQAKKWADSTKNKDRIKKVEERIEDVLEEARKVGLTKGKNEENIKSIVSMPTYIDLVDSQLGEASNYRLLSAMTHANNWALLGLGYKLGPKIKNINLITRTLDIKSVKYLARLGISAFKKQIINRSVYFEWPLKEIKEVFNEIENSLP